MIQMSFRFLAVATTIVAAGAAAGGFILGRKTAPKTEKK